MKVRVKNGEALGKYKNKIIDFIQPFINHPVRNKTPLVYVNWTKVKDGKYYLFVVNHGTEKGTVEIKSPWKNVRKVISSADILKQSIHYDLQDGWLKIDLDSHAGIILTENS